jgi:hypothetical protein
VDAGVGIDDRDSTDTGLDTDDSVDSRTEAGVEGVVSVVDSVVETVDDTLATVLWLLSAFELASCVSLALGTKAGGGFVLTELAAAKATPLSVSTAPRPIATLINLFRMFSPEPFGGKSLSFHHRTDPRPPPTGEKY